VTAESDAPSSEKPPVESEEQEERRRRFLPFWLFLLLLVVVVILVVSRCGRGTSVESTSTRPAATVPTTEAAPVTEAPAAITTPNSTAATTAPTSAATTTEPAALDVSGEWSFVIDVTETSGVCAGEEDENVEPRLVTIRQEGDALTVTGLNAGHPPWKGVISGSTVTFGGARDEDQGTTRASFTLTFDVETGTFTGAEAWSWEGQGQSCPTGASEVTAVRS